MEEASARVEIEFVAPRLQNDASNRQDKPARRSRGAMMHVLLTQGIPMGLQYDAVRNLPQEQWDARWLNACNPRVFVPLAASVRLLGIIAGEAGARVESSSGRAVAAFKAWTDMLNEGRVVNDEQREKMTHDALMILLQGAYPWMSFAAWLLESLHPTLLMELTWSEFGAAAEAPPGRKPSKEDCAVMCENLIRRFMPLDRLFLELFSTTGDDNAREARRTAVERSMLARVVWLARISLSRRLEPFIPERFNVDRLIERGLLGQIADMQELDYASQSQFREVVHRLLHAEEHPPWLKVLV